MTTSCTKLVSITTTCLLTLASQSYADQHNIKPTNTLEEIIITAQKREQPLSKTPIAIGVLDRELINKAGVKQLSNITKLTPNVQIALPNGDVLPIVSIRGVSMADYSTNQSSPIGVYHDDIYLSANYMHGLPLFDLKRIEVLKGPQGTLFGKNTTGGAIHLISNTPDFNSDGVLRASYGNYHAREIEGAYETPIIDNIVAARVAFNIAKADGYTENHFPNQDDLSAVDRHALRLILNYQATDSIDAQLILASARSDAHAQAVISESTLPGGIDLISYLSGFAIAPYVKPASYSSHDTNANKADKMTIEIDNISLKVNWQTDQFTVTSISAFYDAAYDLAADSDGLPVQVLELDYISDSEQWSQEFRIVSNQIEPFGYIAGLYFSQDNINTEINYDYFHSLEAIAPGFNPPYTGFTQVERYEQKRNSRAAYGQISYQMNEQLTLTSGLRFTQDRNKQFNVHTFMADYNRTPMIGLIPSSVPYDPNSVNPSMHTRDNEWTGTLKLDYDINDQHMIYTSYSRGYRSSAFNGAAVNAVTELKPAAPEYVNAYEVGAKGNWLNGQLSYATALFYYNYTGLQFLNIVGVEQRLESAKSARIQGLELDITAKLTSALTLNAGLGIIDSEFKEGINLNAQGQAWDLSGNSLANAPDLNANLSANYQLDLTSGTLNLFISGQYIDDQWFTAFNDKAGHNNIGQSAYSVLDGRISFKPINSQLNIALWGKNLSDKEYKTFAINLSENFGYNYTIAGAPRTYGIELSMTF